MNHLCKRMRVMGLIAIVAVSALTVFAASESIEHQRWILARYLGVRFLGMAPEMYNANNPNPDIQRFQSNVDEKFQLILSRSRIGQSVCGTVFNAKPENISRALGINPQAAQSIASSSGCGRFVHPWAQIRFQPHWSLLSIARLHTLVPTKIDPIFDSWTSGNFTFIPVTLPEIWWDFRRTPYERKLEILAQAAPDGRHLIEILAHEMAIFLDDKNIGWLHPATSSWAVNWGSPAANEILERARGDGGVKAALEDPLISLTLATIRAYLVEGEVMSDLGLRPTLLPFDLSQARRPETCASAIVSVANHLSGFEAFIGAEPGRTAGFINTHASNLARAKMTAADGSVVSACVHLTTPSLSLRNTDKATGPRGGGKRGNGGGE